jgi:ABC-type branched-subunit amino acid transport system ATPase component/ABC-type branched-subunit amino acid transport system permease subunit
VLEAPGQRALQPGQVSGLTVQISSSLLVLGALLGLCYGVLGVGVVLVQRSSRVVNLAHGQVGSFAAAVLVLLVLRYDVPYWLAAVIALLTGGLVGATIELLVVRRLVNAPRVVLLVATIGVLELLIAAQAALPDLSGKLAVFPLPLHRQVQIGSLRLTAPSLLVLVVIPALVLGLTLFLSRTPTGLALRAAADNRDAAVLAGVATARVSTVVWALAGVTATISVALIDPLLGTTPQAQAEALGPSLLLRSLTAALIGGFTSLPRTLAGGVVVGVTEVLLSANLPTQRGLVDVVLLGIVLVAVLVVRDKDSRASDVALLGAAASPRVPAASAGLLARRNGLLALLLVGGALAIVPVFGPTAETLTGLSGGLLKTVVALSLVVLTGWAGQLSLGQMTLFGVGSTVSALLVNRGVPFWAAVVEGALAGVVVAPLVGLPALRVRGLSLALTTLALAVAGQSWFFTRPLLGGQGTPLPVVRPSAIRSNGTYFELCLGLLALVVVGLLRLRAAGVGRVLIAVRGNEDRAAALTLSPAVAKLSAFALSGGIAALAGGLFAGLKGTTTTAEYGPYASLQILTVVALGGLGSVGGTLVGAGYVFGAPLLLGGSPSDQFVAAGTGLLLVLLYLPGGLGGLLERLQGLLVRDTDVVDPVRTPLQVRERLITEGPVLLASSIVVEIGGRRILDGVDLRLAEGEVLGLIGANGAGKSTLLDVLAGRRVPTSGSVLLRGQDVTALPPQQRARLGMGRVFQDARLFEDLTVLETLAVAVEGRRRTELIPSLLALPPARRMERATQADAAEVLTYLNLGPFAHRRVAQLSTGIRRVLELGCLLAQDADVLLLDEPTAGLAQAEVEAFAPLLMQVRTELRASIVLVEHDVPLVVALADRLQALALGTTLAEGLPEAVRDDPAVVEAYLGTGRAVQRSR